uniref:Nanos-type domain-containing protein n=1 Tax=Meloidogyne hapla TaxID=6305 RepID=A0A1I8BAA6_MELHA
MSSTSEESSSDHETNADKQKIRDLEAQLENERERNKRLVEENKRLFAALAEKTPRDTTGDGAAGCSYSGYSRPLQEPATNVQSTSNVVFGGSASQQLHGNTGSSMATDWSPYYVLCEPWQIVQSYPAPPQNVCTSSNNNEFTAQLPSTSRDAAGGKMPRVKGSYNLPKRTCPNCGMEISISHFDRHVCPKKK